jgi:ABC-2 type transport system ATP-binding protein
MGNSLISIKNVSKVYKENQKALHKLNLDIYQNEVIGIIGPNGAGKTTLLKIILGLIFPTEGEVFVNGLTNRSNEVKRVIGYLPDYPVFPDFMTAEQFLEFHGCLYGIKSRALSEKIKKVLAITRMSNYADHKIKSFSKGMVQRIYLSQALLNNPDILILDEPTTGLDPIGIIEFRNLILELKLEGKTIIISSHLLSELEKSCDRFAFILNGKLRKVIESALFKEKKNLLEVELEKPSEILMSCLRQKYEFIQDGCILKFDIQRYDFKGLLRDILDNQGEIISINRKEQSLEKIFVDFINGNENDCI